MCHSICCSTKSTLKGRNHHTNHSEWPYYDGTVRTADLESKGILHRAAADWLIWLPLAHPLHPATSERLCNKRVPLLPARYETAIQSPSTWKRR